MPREAPEGKREAALVPYCETVEWLASGAKSDAVGPVEAVAAWQGQSFHSAISRTFQQRAGSNAECASNVVWGTATAELCQSQKEIVRVQKHI